MIAQTRLITDIEGAAYFLAALALGVIAYTIGNHIIRRRNH